MERIGAPTYGYSGSYTMTNTGLELRAKLLKIVLPDRDGRLSGLLDPEHDGRFAIFLLRLDCSRDNNWNKPVDIGLMKRRAKNEFVRMYPDDLGQRFESVTKEELGEQLICIDSWGMWKRKSDDG